MTAAAIITPSRIRGVVRLPYTCAVCVVCPVSWAVCVGVGPGVLEPGSSRLAFDKMTLRSRDNATNWTKEDATRCRSSQPFRQPASQTFRHSDSKAAVSWSNTRDLTSRTVGMDISFPYKHSSFQKILWLRMAIWIGDIFKPILPIYFKRYQVQQSTIINPLLAHSFKYKIALDNYNYIL